MTSSSSSSSSKKQPLSYFQTPLRKGFLVQLTRQGKSQRVKEIAINKWTNDDKKIKEWAYEYHVINPSLDDLVKLRIQLINKLVLDYRLYEEYDTLNKDLWNQFDENDEFQDKIWFREDDSNWWFDHKMKPIYNKLNALIRMRGFPTDNIPKHFPIIDPTNETRLLFKDLTTTTQEEEERRQ